QATNRRRLGRDPDRSRHDLPNHARADVGALVTKVLVTVRRLLGAPAADRGAPARERDALALVGREQGEVWITLAREGAEMALRVERQVVPNVAAIDDDREIHVRRVVLRARRQLDRRAQRLKMLGRMALEERLRSFGAREAELLDRRLRVLLDQV